MKISAVLKILFCWLADRLEMGPTAEARETSAWDERLLFVTDAKAEDGRAGVGGFLGMVPGYHGPWFSLEVTRDWATLGILQEQPQQGVIASLELLATLLAVKLCVPESRDRQVSKLAIRATRTTSPTRPWSKRP